jgi:hypothetical protein
MGALNVAEARARMQRQDLARPCAAVPAEPLWKRVPTRGDNGAPLSDFIMIIPGLRDKPVHLVEQIVTRIQRVFDLYRDAVVYADLNLRLNVLWVSVKPIPGICLELPAALHCCVPEAKLVAHKMSKR